MDMVRVWTPAACLTAATVVSLLAVALAGCGSAGNPVGDSGQQAADWTAVTTPDSRAQYVQQVVTATRVDPNGAPVQLTSRFLAKTPVYVVVTVHGVGQGEAHRLSVRWFLNGTLVAEAGAHASGIVTHDSQVSFSLTYPLPGAGRAELYWDEPVSDNNDTPNERFLAQAITFTVE
jgi:hypothetical protein